MMHSLSFAMFLGTHINSSFVIGAANVSFMRVVDNFESKRVQNLPPLMPHPPSEDSSFKS